MEIPYEVYLAINRQKARYGRFVDTKQWDKFKDIALPDAQFNFCSSDGQVIIRGGKALSFASLHEFTSHFEQVLAFAETLHMFGPGDLTFVSEARDEVQAIWAMQDEFVYRNEDGTLKHTFRGGGYYHEIYQLERGIWKIKTLKLIRTYSQLNVPVSKMQEDADEMFLTDACQGQPTVY